MLVAGCPPSLCHRISLYVTSLSYLSWVFPAFFSGYHSLHCCQTYLNNLFTCHIELFLYLILTNDRCIVSPMGIRILSVHEMCKQLSGQQIRLSLPRCPVFESHYRRLGLEYLTSLFTSNSHICLWHSEGNKTS